MQQQCSNAATQQAGCREGQLVAGKEEPGTDEQAQGPGLRHKTRAAATP